MSPFPERPTSLGCPARGGHVGRLHGNLLDLDERLREAVAQAVGQAAAGVVGQAALSVLGPGDDGPPPRRFAPHRPDPNRPLWQRLDEPEARDRPPWYSERKDDACFRDRDDDCMIDAARPSVWRQVLAAALPALGWWLHRQAGRRTAGAALGCGLVCGLALSLGGRKAGGAGLSLPC